jgi:BT4734-like, N-terminal domain
MPDSCANGQGDWRDIAVSYVPNAWETKTTDISLGAALEKIRNGRWAKPVARIREKYVEVLAQAEKDSKPDPHKAAKDAVAPLKRELPGVTFSGRFKVRDGNGLDAHSGHICADIDKISPNCCSQLIEALKNDPHVQAAFRSPSGWGLKVVFSILPDASKHALSYLAVERHVEATYNQAIDSPCKEIVRLCFMSDDPDIFIREDNAQVLQPIESEPQPGFSTGDEEEPKDTGQWNKVSIAEILGSTGVILPSGHTSFSQSATRLFSILAKTGKFFFSGKRVCVLTDDNGHLSLEVIGDNQFRSAIEGHVRLFSWREEHGQYLLKSGARCTLDQARVLLASSQAGEYLPPVATIHHCPCLIRWPDGNTEVLGKGYHPIAGGRFIEGGAMPWQMSLDEARMVLLETLEEFAFLSPADKSRAFAALISPALKALGCLDISFPLIVIEANDSQAGKGFFLDLTGAIYRQPAGALLTQRTGGVGSFDESLSQRLIEANAIIRIDNIRGRLNSQLLEAILTCPLGGTVSARVPHKGESRVDPHLFSFQLTSNGFQATTDLTNRSCIIRILKRNGHAFKTYGSPLINILGHVKTEQARFLSAAYSVVNEWSAHGMPMSSDTRGQGAFRPWWQIIDWITLNLACLPCPLEGHQAAQAGASNPTLGWLREIFLKLSSQSRLEEPLSASEIAEFCAIHEELKIPGLQASADEEETLRHIGRLMATAFKTGDTVQGEEFVVHRTQETRFVESINQTREFKKYAFHRAQPAH